MLHPAVRLTVGAVGIVGWLAGAKLMYDEGLKIWRLEEPVGTGTSKEYRYRPSDPWVATENAACQQVVAAANKADAGTEYSNTLKTCSNLNAVLARKGPHGTESIPYSIESRNKQNQTCPTDWEAWGSVCRSPAVTDVEFRERLTAKPMPDSVPKELPRPTYLPIESVPWINPLPGADPQNRPLFIPTGDPVRNPNYDPNAAPSATNQPFLQPGVRVVPSPTAAEPWRVDIQPVNRPTDSPEPTDPVSEDDPNSSGGDKPSEKSDFCLENPDVLACAKPDLDTPDGEIPRSTREVTLNEENLFGGGSCPADVYFAPHGLQSLKIWDWNKACGYISSYLKPIVILCCTFAAFMILVPGRTE